MKLLDLEESASFLDHLFLAALNANANRTKVWLMKTEKCSNRESLQEQLKSNLNRRKLTQTLLRGPTTWKVMRRNALNDLADWQIKQSSNLKKKLYTMS